MSDLLDKKITEACHRIEDIYHETNGKCYVSFSGGKDSTVLLALIKQCEDILTIPQNAIPAIFSNTGIELDVTKDFVDWIKTNYYPNLEIIRPEKSFSWVLENEGKPIRSKVKSKDLYQWHFGVRSAALQKMFVDPIEDKLYMKHHLADQDFHFLHDNFNIKPSHNCCYWLKKEPFEKFNKKTGMKGCIIGLRVEEGGARELSARSRVAAGGKLCTWDSHGVINKAPIIDWNDSDVDEFIKRYNVPVSDAYTKYGFRRTGCCCCPYTPDIEQQLEYLWNNEPNKYKASMYWLKDVYIAQNVILPFDSGYEPERAKTWHDKYQQMRREMLEKYRPESNALAFERMMSFNGRMDDWVDNDISIDDPMNVLVLCETSQTVTIKFRQSGHRAFSCSKEMCTGGHPEWHIHDQDIFRYVNGNCTFTTKDGVEHSQIGKWDLIIAEPSCTYTSKGSAVRLFRKEVEIDPLYGTFQMVNIDRFREGLKERDIIIKILNADCDKIAVINPVLMSIYALPEPAQFIQPYMFGDPYKKQTCLWLKGLPKLEATNIVEPELCWANGGSKNADGTQRKRRTVTSKRARLAVNVFPGVAEAMAEQWATSS